MPEQGVSTERSANIYDLFLNGSSSYDAWLNAVSFQIAQVILVLPFSFAQMNLPSGISYQLLYGVLGCWSSFLISVLYLEYRFRKETQGFTFDKHVIQWFEILDGLLGPFWKVLGLIFNNLLLFSSSMIQIVACASTVYYISEAFPKRTWTFIFGACMMFTIFPSDVRNFRVWSFANIIMVTYVAWYLTIAAAIDGKTQDIQHTAPHNFHDYYTGASNCMYAFGGHALTVEFMHAMKEPQKFKTVYICAVSFILSLTLTSATTMYWVYGDQMLKHKNAFSILPRSKYRDAAVVLALMHQVVTFGVNTLPMYLTWEKLLGIHGHKYILRTLARIPIFLALLFIAVMFPFYGLIDSVVGALFTSIAVHIIPCAAFMAVYQKQTARKNVAEKLPRYLNWMIIYCVNVGIIVWISVQAGLGLWASLYNFTKSIHSIGLFAKCYDCHKNGD